MRHVLSGFTHVQVPEFALSGPQVWPGGHVPPHAGVGDVPQVVICVDVVVDVVVVVVSMGQLGPVPPEHASQQLVHAPTIPCIAVQCAVSFLILHFVPVGVVMQQVTALGRPQVEWDAHLFTKLAQL